jgi:upstream activation factor subunit UAF30
MVRNTKAEKSAVKAEGAASVAAPVIEAAAPVAAAAPKEKKASTPKEKKPKAEAVVAAAAPVLPVVEEIVVAATPEPVVAMEVSSESLLSEIEANLQKIGSVYLTLKNDAKSFRKCLAKEKKLAEKNSKVKKAKKTGDVNKVRKPSGFTKPTRISDELAAFLGKPSGTEMSRIDAAKEVINYIKTNNLKDKTNGRIIHPDVVLARLLKTTDADNLHFFNLQSYMKPHFYKAEPVVAATA